MAKKSSPTHSGDENANQWRKVSRLKCLFFYCPFSNEDNSNPKAIGSFALDGAFAVRGVRVMEDKNGHNFVAFPSRAKSDGSYEDLAFPLSKELYTVRIIVLAVRRMIVVRLLIILGRMQV